MRTKDFWELRLISASAEGNESSDAIATAVVGRHMTGCVVYAGTSREVSGLRCRRLWLLHQVRRMYERKRVRWSRYGTAIGGEHVEERVWVRGRERRRTGDDKVLDVTAPVLGISRPRHRDEGKQLEASTKTWREPHPSDVKAPVQHQTPRSVVCQRTEVCIPSRKVAEHMQGCLSSEVVTESFSCLLPRSRIGRMWVSGSVVPFDA